MADEFVKGGICIFDFWTDVFGQPFCDGNEEIRQQLANDHINHR